MNRAATLRALAPTIGCLVLGVGIGRAFAPHTNLYINGTLASSHVFDHNGTACAPIADIAKAMSQTVVTLPDGYGITSVGGQNQVAGVTGKVGQTMSNGQITFQVIKVIRTDDYKMQFDTGEAKADGPTKDVVEVICRVKNASPKAFTLAVYGGDKSGLTDQDSHVYSFSRFASDVRAAGPTLLPGSAADFAIGYNFPKGEKLGDFLYQINAGGSSMTYKETTFRISLASENP